MKHSGSFLAALQVNWNGGGEIIGTTELLDLIFSPVLISTAAELYL